MAERVSRWKIAQSLGRPRGTALSEWFGWEIIPAPDESGTWDSSVLDRVEHARRLEPEGRLLFRRALLLQRDGFPVSRRVRRRAVAEVLRKMRRKAHKVSQIIREASAMGPGPAVRPRRRDPTLLRPDVEPERWPAVVEAAPDDVFDSWYQWAGTFLPSLDAIARAKNVPQVEAIPYEERLSLLLLTQLLNDLRVRSSLGLPPARSRQNR
jgi:hypothetical protein